MKLQSYNGTTPLLLTISYSVLAVDASHLKYPGNGMANEWSTGAVLVGAIMGIIIGLGTVLFTVLSVSICMKRGII